MNLGRAEEIEFEIKHIVRTNKVNKLFDLISAMDIVLKERELGGCFGAYIFIQRNRTILLNSSLSESHKKVVLAHEVCHAIFHKDTRQICAYSFFQNEVEKEANYGAVVLLHELGVWQSEDFTVKTLDVTKKDKGIEEACGQWYLNHMCGGISNGCKKKR